MEAYEREFYAQRHERTTYAANTVLSVLLEHVPQISSAVDVGCGVGTWLSVLQTKGVKEIQGFDGPWVDQSLLAIPPSCFSQVDLSKMAVKATRRFDLALSLEVAEHLSSERAREFVASLTALSDRVLFSAAIPFQGGKNHINEQWQSYWANLFAERGYVVEDVIRPRIWGDQKIAVWYRQNVLLFSKGGPLGATAPSKNARDFVPLNTVHPDLYLRKVDEGIGLKSILKVSRRTLRKYLGYVFGKRG